MAPLPQQDLPEDLRYCSKIVQYGDLPEMAGMLGRLAPDFLDHMQQGPGSTY